jgi:DNA processing protein
MSDALQAKIIGKRSIIDIKSCDYPRLLLESFDPPEKLYVIGDCSGFNEGLAVVGARKATPYGTSCAKRFAGLAAERGISIISGGARGCDSAAHKSALEHSGKTIVVLGGGCDQIYPKQNFRLFQNVVDSGGALVSEWDWDAPALPYAFRLRNRIIAGIAKATLVVEAGLPSGTFITADETLEIGREVLVVPGSITSQNSKGTNRLLYQGATPVVDDESFLEIISTIFDNNALRAMRENEYASLLSSDNVTGGEAFEDDVIEECEPDCTASEECEPSCVASVEGEHATSASAGCELLCDAFDVNNHACEFSKDVFEENIASSESSVKDKLNEDSLAEDPLISAIMAQPLSSEDIYHFAKRCCTNENLYAWSATRIERALTKGLIARYPDGKYGAYV